MTLPRFSLRTLLLAVTVFCVAFPFVLHAVMQWSRLTIFIIVLCAILLIPTLAYTWFASAMDRWAEREREAEELRKRDR